MGCLPRHPWVPQGRIGCSDGPWRALIAAFTRVSCVSLQTVTFLGTESGSHSLMHAQHMADYTAWGSAQGMCVEWRKEGMDPREQGQVCQRNWGIQLMSHPKSSPNQSRHKIKPHSSVHMWLINATNNFISVHSYTPSSCILLLLLDIREASSPSPILHVKNMTISIISSPIWLPKYWGLMLLSWTA